MLNILELLRRTRRRFESRFTISLQSDEQFVHTAFREILGRDPDYDGMTHYRAVLRAGTDRMSVLLDILRSDEAKANLSRDASVLPDLRSIRPDRYRWDTDQTTGQAISLFKVVSREDYDWLESMILAHGFYEHAGVWNFGIDTDKRLMAEIVGLLGTGRVLEIGCAAGAVLDCLIEKGIDAEGIEISSLALEKARARTRLHIHHGDLLTLNLSGTYEVIFGLDIFEHLNPNKLPSYLSALYARLADGGWLFCNIPMFGLDSVFGEVFPLYVADWRRDAAADGILSSIHCDERGFPLHGHLIWATANWWSSQFADCGFVRESAVERALHARYDAYMKKHSRARLSYFVFSRNARSSARDALLQRIHSAPSLLA